MENGFSCGLLQRLTGLRNSDHCAVSRDACTACAAWYPPTEDHLNPVVASLLFTLTSSVIQSGGAAECDVGRATELQKLALTSIPHDSDAIPIRDHVERQHNTSIVDIGMIVPRPVQRYGPAVREWAVAVTTAPRRQTTLNLCLDSLNIAGWSAPRIIADGDVVIEEQWRHLPVTHRNPQIGAWPSYYLTLIELLMRQPQADAFLIVQDDVVMFRHSGLRDYLESILWPDRRPGVVSLFCSRAYMKNTPGWHCLDTSLVWGGQALIFSGEAAVELVSDPRIVRHRFQGDRGLTGIDGLIGAWAFDTNTPVYVSSPSLSQHIGHVSSLWTSQFAWGNRSASVFAGNPRTTDDPPTGQME